MMTNDGDCSNKEVPSKEASGEMLVGEKKIKTAQFLLCFCLPSKGNGAQPDKNKSSEAANKLQSKTGKWELLTTVL